MHAYTTQEFIFFGDVPAAQDNTPDGKQAELLQAIVEAIVGTADVIAAATRATPAGKILQKQDKKQKKRQMTHKKSRRKIVRRSERIKFFNLFQKEAVVARWHLAKNTGLPAALSPQRALSLQPGTGQQCSKPNTRLAAWPPDTARRIPAKHIAR